MQKKIVKMENTERLTITEKSERVWKSEGYQEKIVFVKPYYR